MNNEPPKGSYPAEDIDLLLLIERSLLFFRRFKWLFITAAVLGIGLGITAYKLIPNTYKSRLIIQSAYLPNPEHIQIISNWSQLLKKKQYDDLAEILHCRKEILPTLKKLSATEIQKVFTPNNPNGFYIDVDVTDNAVLKELQEALVYGLQNNEYVKLRVESRKNNLRFLIDQVSAEIAKLQSNKEEIENILKGKGKSSSSLIVDGFNINKQLIEMNEKLIGYKEDLKFANAVHVLQSFIPARKPSDPKLISLLAIGLILFTGLAYLIALFTSVNQQLKKRRLENSVG
jgi:uncharacterized protein involved in exopolysaccharide biosynthesis